MFVLVCSVPDDLSLKVYRVEANWAMMRFPDALTDLDYLCCLRPNWTEVRDAHSHDMQHLELPLHSVQLPVEFNIISLVAFVTCTKRMS